MSTNKVNYRYLKWQTILMTQNRDFLTVPRETRLLKSWVNLWVYVFMFKEPVTNMFLKIFKSKFYKIKLFFSWVEILLDNNVKAGSPTN